MNYAPSEQETIPLYFGVHCAVLDTSVLVSAVLALVASLLWGLADFGGGALTRRMPALAVVVSSQLVAAVLLTGTVLAGALLGLGDLTAAGPRLWYAAAAGLIGPFAMLCFYRALAEGPMGVVSPLATLGVAVPVGAGLLLGERPGIFQAVGIAVAVLGVTLAGGPQRGGPGASRQVLLLTLTAAFGFGAVMVLIAQASAQGSLLLVLCVQRLCNVLVGGGALLVSLRRMPDQLSGSRLLRAVRTDLPLLAAVGVADVAANGSYALAARSGTVAVAAVLASLYPVVTALLARGLFKERLLTVQLLGAGLTVAGTVLLATG